MIAVRWRCILLSQACYKDDYLQIKAEVSRRQITRLVHFTPTMNLISIFEQDALLSRQQLLHLSVEYPDLHLDDYLEINDKLRLDGMVDFINLSIQHANHYLLKKFRESCRDWCDSWAVISISPEYLYVKETQFSVANAAARISQQVGIGDTYKNFIGLFQEKTYGSSNRVFTRTGLKDCYPTDVQAEVLVKGKICVENILEVSFETDEELRRSAGAIRMMYSGTLPKFTVNKSMFQQRV